MVHVTSKWEIGNKGLKDQNVKSSAGENLNVLFNIFAYELIQFSTETWPQTRSSGNHKPKLIMGVSKGTELGRVEGEGPEAIWIMEGAVVSLQTRARG